ncbi:unnamed protein product [Taenia asiatica]|uniref:B box-type domain-containing protein n=1 Tax=Taenia asiatica TaxID=60517 RepID=A0A158R9K1_TAEAS|nr:unnamed protein product [Taenia asiatica]
MAPSYSDVDEVTSTLQNFQGLTDVENGAGEMPSTQRNRAKHGRERARRLNTSTPVQRHAITLPTRQRTISDVSDTTQSDSEDGDTRASISTSLSGISSNAFGMEVRGRGRFRNTKRRSFGRTADLSLSSSGISDVDESVEQRRKAVDNQRRVNKKCRHEAHKRSKSQHKDSTASCNPDCRQCQRRQTRLAQQSSQASTDLGISTSDIDDDAHKPTDNTQLQQWLNYSHCLTYLLFNSSASKIAKTNSEIDEVDGDTLTRKLVKTGLRCQSSTLYSRVEAHHCEMCCDIDAQTSECEFCGLTLCGVCCRLHFSMHAKDVKDRLDHLRNLAVSSSPKEAHHRLMVEIDEAVLDLTIACNMALDRAIDVYRATASISTSFIGSLVDRRIKLSNSLKYLLRQIPRILISDDLYELMYFIKVAKSVHERMEELQIAIGDPRSEEVFKLVLTNAFSSFDPLFEQFSLLLPLDGCDQPQGQADVQSKSDGLQKVNKNVDVSFLELQSTLEKM